MVFLLDYYILEKYILMRMIYMSMTKYKLMYISIVLYSKRRYTMYDRCSKCDHSTTVNTYLKKIEGCETYQIKNNKNISDFLGIRR